MIVRTALGRSFHLRQCDDRFKGCGVSVRDGGRGAAFGELSGFRRGFYEALTARADALFELADAVLCADGPVRSLAELSLVGEHRRGHGGLYDAVACGRVDDGRLRDVLAAVPLPRAPDGRLVLWVECPVHLHERGGEPPVRCIITVLTSSAPRPWRKRPARCRAFQLSDSTRARPVSPA